MSEINFFQEEEKISKFWKENRIFEKSVEGRSADNPASFYDGPPFVTGVPHYGHLLGSIAKDVIPRYLTMKGKRVRRVWGWDCHGLPIENKVEQKLGLKNRRDIEKIGLEKFINECRDYVSQTSAEWDWYVEKIGRWVDMEHAYRTMDLDYMESVLWVFKQLYDRSLIYKGMRISLFCPRCSTPISNFEIAMDNSYADARDTAITIKFKIKDETFLKKYQVSKPCYLLAWTTTPWSCVSVMGLAVGPDFKYQLLETEEACFVVAEKRVAETMKGLDFKVLADLAGSEVIGLPYEHVFGYYRDKFADYKTWPADYVSETEGTGIVTINGAFGDVDMDSAKKYHLPIIVNVDEEGRFTPEAVVAQGLPAKEAEKLIIADLEKRSLLFKKEGVTHSYPFCYRCDTPLMYRAQDSWFIDVQKLKPELLKNNQAVNWVPEHFKEGRFRQGIEMAPDWCISRNRYWATAMPVWECEKCQSLEVFGSRAEIEKRSGQTVKDLHRPFIDEIVFPCQKCSGQMKRVKEVLDCWLESGSMPYAERHYPFENKTDFEKSFPADYISEYTGQVRAWFYVLHVLSTALFHSHSFKNVVVSGVIMGTDGRKMSKHFNNFPDPRAVIEKYGGDALRLYLMGSPTMKGEDMIISENGVKEQARGTILILWNCFVFFQTFARVGGFKPDPSFAASKNLLDRWLISRQQGFFKDLTGLLDGYHIPEAVRLINDFLDDLSRWYIRRSRERFKRGDAGALNTLYQALLSLSRALAPLVPFLTENIYRGLLGPKESVHLDDWPVFKSELIDPVLEGKMVLVREICNLGLSLRQKSGLKIRQPLAELKVVSRGGADLSEEMISLVRDELNIKKVKMVSALTEEEGWLRGGSEATPLSLKTELTPELKEEGQVRDLLRFVQEQRKVLGLKPGEKIEIAYAWPKDAKDLFSANQKLFAREAFIEKAEPKDAADLADGSVSTGQGIVLKVQKVI